MDDDESPRYTIVRGSWFASTREQLGGDPSLRIDDLIARAELHLARFPERSVQRPVAGQRVFEAYAPWNAALKIQVVFDFDPGTRVVRLLGVYRDETRTHGAD